MNRWNLQEELKERYIPILKDYFSYLESLSAEEVDNMKNEEFELDLYGSGLAPYPLTKLLENEFGYERTDQDDNGWELDFWIYFERKDGKSFPSGCESMTIFGCGQTFELALRPHDML